MPERNRAWSLMEVLNWTTKHFESKGIDNPRLDAEIILSHSLNMQRIMLYARFDQPLSADELASIRSLVARRARREPIAHLLEKREFWSLEFKVSADVLIPRADTETLIETAKKRAPEAKHIVDVGTGSGNIILALSKEYPTACLFGLDISPNALNIAQENAKILNPNCNLHFIQSNLLENFPQKEPVIDLLVANLPYIPSHEILELMEDVRNFEPHLALDGGPDGLTLINQLILDSFDMIVPGGLIALESTSQQTEQIAKTLEEVGFADVEITSDMAGLPRITSAFKAK